MTENDHTAWIIIATALGLSCILVFSVIEIFIRWTISATVGLDEVFLAASTILALIQSSIVLGACSNGLGKSVELLLDGKSVKIQQMYYISNLFFVISLGLSKISVAFLLVRLTPQQGHRRVFHGMIGHIVAWTVASTFTIALQCNLSHPWILIQESCARVFLRWQLISAFDIIFELCLVSMTIYLVWSLQTVLETKLMVVFSFGMRLPLIIAIAFRLANFNTVGLTTNPTFLQDKFIVWTQTELSYSIIAATIPSLRPFIKTLSTNYGTVPANGYGSGYRSGYANSTDGNMQSSEYQLSSLRPKGKGDKHKHRTWSGGIGEESRAANRTDTASVGSSDSQRMIINQDSIWEFAADLI